VAALPHKVILRSRNHSLSFRAWEMGGVLIHACKLKADGKPDVERAVRDFSCSLEHGWKYLRAARRCGFKVSWQCPRGAQV